MQTVELGHVTIPTPDQRVFFVNDDRSVQVGRIAAVCLKLHAVDEPEILCEVVWEGEEGPEVRHRRPEALYDSAAAACDVAFQYAVGRR